ncbi:response regulator [Hyphomicrobium sp.]|uniref:response regulator n=1 Tax=Hyphomicrobium sp. TaxID=82 RepID=UPI003D0FE134
MAKLRIAVVDDHPLMRDGVEHTLAQEADFEVVGRGGSAQEAIDIARAQSPDLMLLDVNMPGGGINAAKEIGTTQPTVRLLFLTVSERMEDVTAALEAGVRGYVLKGIGGPDLVRTVRSVAAGETYITPDFAARLLAAPATRSKDAPEPLEALTVREEQILREVSLGLTNKEIAKKLDLSEKTIKHYMSGVLHKLSARNRVEAIVASRRLKGGSG